MFKITEVTEQDRKNRPKNVSAMLSDNEWYSMCNELDEVNERTNETWSVDEVLKQVQNTSISGCYSFSTIYDFQTVLETLNNIEG